MKKMLAGFALMASLGCKTIPATDQEAANEYVKEIVFARSNNGLCFAFLHPRFTTITMTIVPTSYCPTEIILMPDSFVTPERHGYSD